MTTVASSPSEGTSVVRIRRSTSNPTGNSLRATGVSQFHMAAWNALERGLRALGLPDGRRH